MCLDIFKQRHPRWDNGQNYRYMKDGSETIVFNKEEMKKIEKLHKSGYLTLQKCP